MLDWKSAARRLKDERDDLRLDLDTAEGIIGGLSLFIERLNGERWAALSPRQKDAEIRDAGRMA